MASLISKESAFNALSTCGTARDRSGSLEAHIPLAAAARVNRAMKMKNTHGYNAAMCGGHTGHGPYTSYRGPFIKGTDESIVAGR